jgi:hypothetical protein
MIEVLPQVESASDEMVRAVAFHTAQEPPSAADPTPEQQAADKQALHDSVDFHKIISSLNEHPALLRRLGIVVDLAARSGPARSPMSARPRRTGRCGLPGRPDRGGAGRSRRQPGHGEQQIARLSQSVSLEQILGVRAGRLQVGLAAIDGGHRPSGSRSTT